VRAASNHPAVPVLPKPLIGRERKITAGRVLLHHPGVRLPSLTGPGGAGKIRLALALAAAAADAFPGGVHVVEPTG
jgi:hypothetical protein